MGAFLKIFIAIMCMSVLLSIAFPGEETQFLNDNFFTKLLEQETDPLTGNLTYTGLSDDVTPQWSEGGNQESSFLQKFIDGLSVIKTFVITLINIAALPITIAVRLQMPIIIRILFFIPLALIYILTAAMTLIRGVQP